MEKFPGKSFQVICSIDIFVNVWIGSKIAIKNNNYWVFKV